METTVFQILHVLNESQVFVPARQIAEQLGLSGTAPIMPFLTRMAAEGLVRYESGEGYALPESREFEELVNVAGPFADKLQESGIALVSVAPSEDLPEEIEVERRESSDLLSSLADYERVIADGGLSPEAFEVFFSEAAQDENLAVEDENGVRWVLNDAGYWLPQIDEVRKAASKGGYWRTTKNGHRIYIEGGKITKGNPYLLKIVAAGQKKKAKKRTESFETVESVEEAEKPDDLDATYASWRKSVNMSASQLRAWSNSPCSRKASLSASAVIERNLELLETPKEKWDSRLVANAKRTISFIARMSKMEQGEPVSEECKISKRDISLKNWAYDPAKGRNESVEDGIGSNQYPMDLRVGMRVRFVTGGSGSYGSGTTGTIIGRNNENNLWIVRDDAGGVEEWERMDLHPEIQPQDYDARTDADLEMASESEISEWGVAAQRGRVRAMQQARDRVRFAGSRSDDDEDEEEPKGRKSDKKDSDEEEVEERTVSANVGGFDPDLLGAGEEDEDYEDEEEEDDISPEAEFGEAHWSSGLKSDGLPRFATQDGEDEEDSEAEVVIEAAAKTVKVWPKDQEDHRKIMAEYSKALMDRKNAVSLNASRRMRKLETVPVPELPSKPVFPFAFDGSRYIGMLDADFENLSPDEIAKQLKRAGAEVEGKISVRWLHHANEALDEVSPPGFKGTVKAMKRAQARGDIPADSNVFALAWAMKKRGAKPHYSSKAPFKKKAESEEPVSNTVFEWKNDGSGDCMEVAARYVLENHAQNPNLILVHALVYGRGPIEGRRFTHAWVLDGNTVIDKSNGLNVRMDRTAYERMGGVNTDEEGAYMEYDHRSLVTNLKLSKHWGPWDLDPDLEEGIPTSVRQIGKLRKRLSADDLSLLDGAAATEAVRVEDSKLHEFAKVAKELGVPLTTELEQEDDGSWTIYLDSRVAAKIRAKLV